MRANRTVPVPQRYQIRLIATTWVLLHGTANFESQAYEPYEQSDSLTSVFPALVVVWEA